MMDVVKNVPLSPAVTGALLYTLTRAPEQLKGPALEHLSKYLSPKNVKRTITALKWLFAAGIARNLHVWLSGLAQNNFRLRSERHRYDWPNEVVVITGAASGFGARTAKGFRDKGLTVIALDLRDELPEDVNGAKVHYYKCDVTDRQAVIDLGEKIKQDHGEVSILINNAGIASNNLIIDTKEDALNKVFDVNVISHYWTLQAFLPDMIKNRKGHVVALASMASFVSSAGLVPYSNTKVAVLSLHEGLQQELRAVHKCPEIKLSIVHPIFALTGMTSAFMGELSASKAVMIDPQTVADAIVKQVLSGKGGQIVLGASVSWVAGIRGWPHWISQTLIRTTDSGAAKQLGTKSVLRPST